MDFKRYVKLSRVILCLEIKELCSLYIYIYIFCVIISKEFFFFFVHGPFKYK